MVESSITKRGQCTGQSACFRRASFSFFYRKMTINMFFLLDVFSWIHVNGRKYRNLLGKKRL